MFFHYFKWNSGGLGVSRRTAPSIRCYLQSFSRFGGTWGQKVHFSTFSGKLTFQSSRNGLQTLHIVQGLSRTPLLVIPRYLTNIIFEHIFQKKNLENRKSENLKFQKPWFTNKCPVNRKSGSPGGPAGPPRTCWFKIAFRRLKTKQKQQKPYYQKQPKT